MPAAVRKATIPRETVKTLAKAIGLRPAARQLGIDENLVLQWSARDPNGPWSVKPKDRNQGVITPSAAIGNVLESGQNLAILSLKEKREYLASIVRTPVGEVNESSPLAQKVKRTSSTNKNGQTFDTEEIELPGKLRAIELDAKLAGELDNNKTDPGLISVALIRLELPQAANEKPPISAFEV